MGILLSDVLKVEKEKRDMRRPIFADMVDIVDNGGAWVL